MTIGILREKSVHAARLAFLIACMGIAPSARAQLLYSFEPDLQGWGPTGFDGSDVLSVTHSTLGPTDGTHSMAIERGRAVGTTNAFSWDAGHSVSSGSIYDVYAAAAGDHTKYALDFDVTFTPEGWAGVTGYPAFFSIQVSVNGSASGENNFDQVLNAVPAGSDTYNLMSVDGAGQPVPKYGTHRYSIPLVGSTGGSETGLYLVPNSLYYQLNIGSNLTNALFMPADGSMKYFVDNIHISRLPDLIPETLFSWETPDDPVTTTVNEQYEGWVQGFHTGHTHSLTSTGATHGNTALQIHREQVVAGNFVWGSQFVLSSDTNPDPEIEDVDPVIQQRIGDLKAKILDADRIALDVSFDPTEFDGSPTYTRFGLHFSDSSNFFQAEFANFNILSFTGPTTLTMELPITAFHTPENDPAQWRYLNIDEVFDDGNFFRIGISTNMDGLSVAGTPTPIDFQIDNFRLIREVFPLSGDYNADGVVDAADYVVWRKSVGTTNVLPNDPDGGTIGPAQYATWKANFGAGSGEGGSGGGQAAVPEPSTIAMLLSAVVGGLIVRRRRA